MEKTPLIKVGIIGLLIIILISIFLIGSVSAIKFRQIYNPFTRTLDYYHTANFTGENITAESIVVSGNVTVQGNISTLNTGFFGWLGSLTNRVIKLFVQDIDFTGNINGSGNINTTGNVTSNYFFGDGAEFNGGWLNNGLSIIGGNIFAQVGYFYNITSLNVTKQNLTILDDLIVNGKVGIGTASPSQTLEINGKVLINADVGSDILYFTDTNSGFANNRLFGIVDIAILIDSDNSSANRNFLVGKDSATVGGMTELFRIQEDGKVGIGTDSPDERLHIAGNKKIRIDGPTNYYGLIHDFGGTLILDAVGGGAFITFKVNTDEKMRISDNGNVGIGSINPTTRLFVQDKSGDTILTVIGGEGAVTTGTGKLRLQASSSATANTGVAEIEAIQRGATKETDMAFYTRDAAGTITEKMRITDDGNVGINTPDPTNKLTINQSADGDGIMLYGFDDRSGETGEFYLDSLGQGVVNTSKAVIFRTFGSNALVFGSSTATVYRHLAIADYYWYRFGTGLDYSLGYDVNSDTFRIADGSDLTTNPLMIFDSSGNVNITGNLTLGEKITFAFNEIIDNIIDGWITITGNLNVTGNVTAENVFIPQYIFAHDNRTTSLTGANAWANISFDQEEATIKKGITHTFDDNTNHTFTITESGIYEIDFDFDAIDTSASSTDIDVAGRVIYVNGTEIHGSVFETDITKKDIETEISHTFLARFGAGDTIVFQFIADDVDVQLSTHGTFGDHTDSTTIEILKVANL